MPVHLGALWVQCGGRGSRVRCVPCLYIVTPGPKKKATGTFCNHMAIAASAFTMLDLAEHLI